MVRYDPTQEEHKKFIKDKPDLPKQKRPKKQKLEQTKVIVEPVVDTDKYYKVGDKLKDIFSTPNQFSLTSLFNTDKCKLIKYYYYKIILNVYLHNNLINFIVFMINSKIY